MPLRSARQKNTDITERPSSEFLEVRKGQETPADITFNFSVPEKYPFKTTAVQYGVTGALVTKE